MLKLTLIASARRRRSINAVFGTIIAWVLVRDEFRGKRLVNIVIDLPFALPTIVAGLTLLALYGDIGVLGTFCTGRRQATRVGVVLALLFVTLPFVVRAVQPTLIELDQDMEEAAASLGAGAAHDLPQGSSAEPHAGHYRRRRPCVRASDRRVRLSDPDLGKHPVQDGGRLHLHLQADRGGRERYGRLRGLGRPCSRSRLRSCSLINWWGRRSIRRMSAQLGAENRCERTSSLRKAGSAATLLQRSRSGTSRCSS